MNGHIDITIILYWKIFLSEIYYTAEQIVQNCRFCFFDIAKTFIKIHCNHLITQDIRVWVKYKLEYLLHALYNPLPETLKLSHQLFAHVFLNFCTTSVLIVYCWQIDLHPPLLPTVQTKNNYKVINLRCREDVQVIPQSILRQNRKNLSETKMLYDGDMSEHSHGWYTSL